MSDNNITFDWTANSVHVINELRRLSSGVEALTHKIDEQQSEFHEHRMSALQELSVARKEAKEDLVLARAEAKEELRLARDEAKKELAIACGKADTEIIRLDKEIISIKSKIAIVSASVGAFVGAFVSLIPFFWGLFAGSPEPKTLHPAPAGKAVAEVQVKK